MWVGQEEDGYNDEGIGCKPNPWSAEEEEK